MLLAITAPNFKHICIVKKFHIQNVVRHNRVLLKLDVDIRAKTFLVCLQAYGSFCNSWSLTLVSDGLDVTGDLIMRKRAY